MKILFIGGTGTISMAVSKLLLSQGHTLYLINRGSRNSGLCGSIVELKADINDENTVRELIKDLAFDAVADFIAFTPEQLQRDHRLFSGRTRQFIYISSASAYQKPASDHRISEGTPLANPYWEYSRNKIAGEEFLMKLYREEGFPVTIVRPSHTYSERSVPVGVHGANGSYAVIRRMLEGKAVIIHGDGTSLWTLTHSTDFAKGFAGLVGNIHAIGEAVQITSDESLTWNQIYQIIADALGVKLNALHVSSEFLDACSSYDFRGSLLGDKANTVVFDNRKLKRLVPGFTATVRADQGIRDTLSYVLSHPECQKEDPAFDSWCDQVVSAMELAVKTVCGNGYKA
ncbi:N-acetyl-alpha-D-glucosaminyl-diphospho-ditrans, octacis-undecaprenol 4-epimerase [Lachnospiraceae bacterium]|nr:N-acetyl-alpha-D-glucosaminyl-diphospho-ditrans, octacis-undecaprenol 4-epimerase [Lachnospiraceae bacterium]